MEINGVVGDMMGATLGLLVLEIIVYFGVPLLIVWMIYRYYNNKTNKRAKIIQAIIEKNPDAGNVDELMKKIAPKQKSLKEKLLRKLLWGSIMIVLGVCIFAYALWIDCLGGSHPQTLHLTYFAGVILLGIGLAVLLNYFISKKMLAKEIEAEEKKLTEEANL